MSQNRRQEFEKRFRKMLESGFSNDDFEFFLAKRGKQGKEVADVYYDQFGRMTSPKYRFRKKSGKSSSSDYG